MILSRGGEHRYLRMGREALRNLSRVAFGSASDVGAVPLNDQGDATAMGLFF